MAESFRNFNGEVQVTNHNRVIIIPKAGESINNSQSRSSTDVVQVHSIYICQKKTGDKIGGIDRYEPKNFSAFNLGIIYKNESNQDIIRYIVFDGRVVPGSPFFIEKNITLELNQALFIECPNNSKDYNKESNTNDVTLNGDGSFYLDYTASAVLFGNS